VLEHRREVVLEVEPVRILGDKLGQSRLEDRDIPRLQLGDPVGIDVTTPDVVAQLGKACRAHEADPADADDADR
jgi:hypothetical protein